MSEFGGKVDVLEDQTRRGQLRYPKLVIASGAMKKDKRVVTARVLFEARQDIPTVALAAGVSEAHRQISMHPGTVSLRV